MNDIIGFLFCKKLKTNFEAGEIRLNRWTLPAFFIAIISVHNY